MRKKNLREKSTHGKRKQEQIRRREGRKDRMRDEAGDRDTDPEPGRGKKGAI